MSTTAIMDSIRQIKLKNKIIFAIVTIAILNVVIGVAFGTKKSKEVWVNMYYNLQQTLKLTYL